MTGLPDSFATRLLASIVDSSDDAIVSKNLDGTVTSWNRAAERLFGYTAEEMIGRPISILAPPDRPNEMAAILRRLSAGERIDHFETQRRRKDGSIVHISLTVSPLRDQTGEIIGASKIARDISQQVEARERLELLRREVDHRAKNVLQIVQSLLHLTRAKTHEEYIAALEGRIRILALAHNHVAENEWRGAPLNALLDETLSPFRSSVTHIRLGGPSAFVDATSAQALSLTVNELATNASKYGALSVEGGEVSLSWMVGEDGIRLVWAERGGPRVREPSARGFGTHLIQSVLPNQTGGDVDLRWEEAGLCCELRIPPAHFS
jgi:PAS domain S-box-containing protein